MVPIAGIGNAPEPRDARPVRDRVRREPAKTTEAADGIAFSAKALEASQTARMAEEAAKSSTIRLERVEAAKQNIRNGAHQVLSVVEQVAARLTPYL